ncbi:hypothetical protein [Plantactinospora sp. DSM 117369]
MQTDPAKREDGRVVVAVTVRETPNAEDAARMSEWSRLLIDQALNLFQPPLAVRRRARSDAVCERRAVQVEKGSLKGIG